MLTESDNICKVHADLLAKYKDMFPESFIECIRAGVSWLCTHNGLTYQTSTLIKTDNTVYSADASVLKIGLIDVDKPLSGISYYDVKKVVESIDNVSDNITFSIESTYIRPIGIKVSLIPIKYFDPRFKPEKLFYTKKEMDIKLKQLADEINNTNTPDNIVDDKDVDLSPYLKVMTLGGDYKANEKIIYNNGIIYIPKVDVQNVQLTDLSDSARFKVFYQPPKLQGFNSEVDIIDSADFDQNVTDDKKVPSVKAVNDKILEFTNKLTNEINEKVNITDLDTSLDEKANKNDVYTKEEADEKFEEKR